MGWFSKAQIKEVLGSIRFSSVAQSSIAQSCLSVGLTLGKIVLIGNIATSCPWEICFMVVLGSWNKPWISGGEGQLAATAYSPSSMILLIDVHFLLASLLN